MIHLLGTKLDQTVPFQTHRSLLFCNRIYRWKIMSTHLVPHLQNQWWSWWWSKSRRHQKSSNPHNWWRDNCQCWGKWPNLQEPTLPLQYWLQCPWKPLDHLLLPLHHQKLIHLCIPHFCHLEKKNCGFFFFFEGEKLKIKKLPGISPPSGGFVTDLALIRFCFFMNVFFKRLENWKKKKNVVNFEALKIAKSNGVFVFWLGRKNRNRSPIIIVYKEKIIIIWKNGTKSYPIY